jgi:DNA primase
LSFPADYDVKERVRAAVDIVDLVGGYIDLRRQGRDFVGLCPWHEDSRPSLRVNQERQTWKCWVCNVGGDAFSFLMQRENVDFRQSMEMLAERVGVPLSNSPRPAKATPGSPEDKATLYQAMAWAEQQYHEFLLSSSEAEPARHYLAERGISEESIHKFRLGFAPNKWQWILDRASGTSFSELVLQAVGLVAKSDASGKMYDRFRGRAMFSIRDMQKRPIAFGGRVLPELADEKSAKYINSPETRLFSKSEQFYALDLARDVVAKSRKIVIVEGYTDVIMAHQHDQSNVVAVLGTALGSRHVQLLKRFADVVVLVLDGDEAGQRRTNEILELFVAEQVDLRIVTLVDGLDPCDFLQQRGAAEFESMLDRSVDALEHKLRTTTAGIDLTRDTHRANRALEEILGILAQVRGGEADSKSRLREQQVLTRLSRQFRVDEAGLRGRLAALRGGGHRKKQEKETASVELNDWDRQLFELLVQYPDLAEDALVSLGVNELGTSSAATLYNAMSEILALGETPDLGKLLIFLDDPQLKSLIVELDEAGRDKIELGARECLDQYIGAYQRRRQDLRLQEQISTLENSELSEKEELDQFLDILDKKRDRQGLTAPTDG